MIAKLDPHPYPIHRSIRRQRVAERACDAVLDQILDWPVLALEDLPGERMGQRLRGKPKATMSPVRREPRRDPISGRQRRTRFNLGPISAIREWMMGRD